jgi:glyoxylase-like metal-dependent hydrolase (beta-lactamase superfamily II)
MPPAKLEDQLQDIISKARHGLGLSPRQLAATSGLTPTEIVNIEAGLSTPGYADLARLAAALKLSGPKLAAIALDAWCPARPALDHWGHVADIRSSYGDHDVKCYLQWDDAGNAALFDTGVDANAVLEVMNKNKLRLRGVFITHRHPDHIGAMADIRGHSPHERIEHMESQFPDGFSIQMNGLHIQATPTPGHSTDGMTFIVRARDARPAVAYVGDSLFAGSVGGAGASYPLLLQSVHDRILSLPPDTLICPGHGPLTTVAEEKAHNPFFP